jgi:glutamine synthetase
MVDLLNQLDETYHELKNKMQERKKLSTSSEKALYLDEIVVPCMHELRRICDEIEEGISKENYPLPTYDELFLSVQ